MSCLYCMEFFVAVLVSFVAVFFLHPLAEKMGLVDSPDTRKHHKGVVPLIGGIAVYLSTLAATLVAFPDDKIIHLYLLLSGLIVLLGIFDDYLDLSVRMRLAVQIGLAAGLIYGAGRYISVLGDLVGLGVIDLGWAGGVFTVVAILGAINAFNMVDGIDGLAGIMALTTFLSIALMMYLSGQDSRIALPIILSLSIVPYLLFNLGLVPGPVKKIFMGDAGSMFIGLSVITLFVVGTQAPTMAFRPVTALWVIAIPLMDMAAIILRRVRKGQSPFKPDRGHLHHIFMRAGFGPRVALLIIAYFSIVYAGIGILGDYYQVPEWLMFAAFLVAFAMYDYSISHAWVVVRWVRRRSVKNP